MLHKNKTKHIRICALIIIIVTAFFIFSLNFINKSDGSNNAGTHTWLSWSTLKFTNNWLENGAINDKLTLTELPTSIETPELNDRDPYVSYPSLIVFIVYLCAKLMGQAQISILFINRFSEVVYGLDAVLIAILIYLILEYIFNVKNQKTKFILPIVLSCLWIIFPCNIYYLKNVFFTDQLVLPFIYALLILEILKKHIKGNKFRILINVLLLLTIYLGTLVEYYFWITIGILFLVNIALLLIQRKGFAAIIKETAFYCTPVMLAIGTFLFQLSFVDNWLTLLVNRGTLRMGLDETESVSYFDKVITYITDAYGWAGLIIIVLSIISLVILVIAAAVNLRAKTRSSNHGAAVLKVSLLIILSPLIQMVAFSNHSAMHEFSILKLGFVIIYGIMLIAYLFCQSSKFRRDNIIYLVTASIILIIYIVPTGLFSKIDSYYNARYAQDNYELATYISEISEYEHVFFSYTEEIIGNPPHDIALTKKAVYQITDISEVDSMFPNLDSNAIKCFVINKSADKSEEILNNEEMIRSNYQFYAENDNYEIHTFS